MHTHDKKSPKSKIGSIVNSVDNKKNSFKKSFELVDNRTESFSQHKLQAMTDNNFTRQQQFIQKQTNHMGLPDNLKSGIENLSGYSMDDVKVHYNSDKPAQLNAHGFAQGTEIHLGPEQEKHLPHEAWHVVQQKQGRVKSTMQMGDKLSINDDAGLENEADIMGAKANSMHISFPSMQLKNNPPQPIFQLASISKLMEDQAKLQHNLKGNDQRHREYWSSGFEFEFATYKNDRELPSHISLATSKGTSELHPDLNFELETDNHWEIEISIPPLYFPRGDTEKAEIKDAHDSLRSALKQAREESIAEGERTGTPSKLKFLTDNLKGKGIGSSDWVLTELGERITVDSNRIKHPKKDQFDNENDEIYGQINVTMTTDEIVSLMDKIEKKYKESPNEIEKGPLGKFFLATSPIKDTGSMKEGERTEYVTQRLYSKMISNIFAIPAILFRKDPQFVNSLGKLPDEWEMSSTVKELFSVWIKALNQDVIKSRPQLKKELIDELELKASRAHEEINTMLDAREPPACSIIRTFLKVQNVKKERISKLSEDIKKELGGKKSLVEDRLEEFTHKYGTYEAIKNILGESWALDDIENGYAGEAFTGSGIESYLNNVIAELKVKVSAPDIKLIKDLINIETNSLILRMRGIEVGSAVSPDGPWKEDFGTGEGVRKETFIQAMGVSREYLLTEIRSDAALSFWLSTLKEK
jgi:hypothetical protein